MNCPRCQAKPEDCVQECQGMEADVLIWTIYHCTRCSFSWRDSEPDSSINYDVREASFRMDPDQPEKYFNLIPPAIM